MFIVKRMDTNMYYTQSWNQDSERDGLWIKKIDYAKIYLSKSGATRQKNVMKKGLSFEPPVDYDIEVIKVRLSEDV